MKNKVDRNKNKIMNSKVVAQELVRVAKELLSYASVKNTLTGQAIGKSLSRLRWDVPSGYMDMLGDTLVDEMNHYAGQNLGTVNNDFIVAVLNDQRFAANVEKGIEESCKEFEEVGGGTAEMFFEDPMDITYYVNLDSGDMDRVYSEYIGGTVPEQVLPLRLKYVKTEYDPIRDTVDGYIGGSISVVFSYEPSIDAKTARMIQTKAEKKFRNLRTWFSFEVKRNRLSVHIDTLVDRIDVKKTVAMFLKATKSKLSDFFVLV